jgi:hypothetical protein
MSVQACVFWVHEGQPFGKIFDGEDALGHAMAHANYMRRHGRQHVTISTENANQVGQNGVDSIVDGKTPDGERYDWTKRR